MGNSGKSILLVLLLLKYLCCLDVIIEALLLQYISLTTGFICIIGVY